MIGGFNQGMRSESLLQGDVSRSVGSHLQSVRYT